ncbi:MAG: Unknown protein [uncultured Sulfurovum sp.]|uniref:Uncharacterized protein n=1 Tax=uncultured Sulfurovum sp. TaxID=269237 RepID=A0A6S6SFT5_9BACT|nr:MAG: Unknown protein [uncultured Sulfurovum sp.]
MSELHPAIGKMLEKYDLSTADKTYEALRILYGLDRFSEDLNFSLIEPNEEFDLGVYEKSICFRTFKNSYSIIRHTKC